MANVSQLLTLGIGNPSDIAHFILAGLTPSGPVTISPSTSFTARIEMQFTPSVWESVDSDFILRNGYRWSRGNQSMSPIDTVAAGGMLEFTLRNDAGCSGGVQGYYSPNHFSCRAGFNFGTPTRLVFTVGGVDRVRWTGKLRVIRPAAGLYGEQATRCIAQDFMGELSEADILEVPRQINQPDDVLVSVLLDSLPPDSQPTARSVDSGLDVVPVAFDNLGSDGGKGLNVLEQITTSGRARAYVKGDDTFIYLNRNSLSTRTPSFTFTAEETELEVPSDLGNVFNRVKVVLHQKDIPATIIVLSSYTGSLQLPPGESQDVWLPYRDPDTPTVPIGGTGYVNPLVPGTDFVFNSLPDGSGADLTASITIGASFFASTVKLTITNTGGSTAYKQTLQVRGQGIFDRSPLTVQAYTPRSYDRPITIDTPLQNDVTAGQAMAEFIEATYRDLSDQVKSIMFYPQLSSALMQRAMDVEVFDVVGVSDPVVLPNGALTLVQYIEQSVDENGIMICKLMTSPWIVEAGILPGQTLLFSDVLTYVAATAETRIDQALIEFSEVA